MGASLSANHEIPGSVISDRVLGTEISTTGENMASENLPARSDGPTKGTRDSLASSVASRPQKRRAEDNEGVEAQNSACSSASEGSSVQKRPRLGDSRPRREASADLDEGEILESPAESEPSVAVKSVPEPPARLETGWNRGITSGLRTSFGGALVHVDAPKATHEHVAPQPNKSHLWPSDEKSNTTIGNEKEEDAAHFKLAQSVSSTIFKSNPYKDEHTYRIWFTQWLLAVLSLNSNVTTVLDSPDLIAAYNKWLGSQDINKKRRKGAEGLARILNEGKEYKALVEKIKLGSSPTDHLKKLARAPTNETLSQDWKFPMRLDVSSLQISLDDSRKWEAFFIQWCNDFIKLNERRLDIKKEAQILVDCYKVWLKGTPKALQKAAAKAARLSIKRGKLQAKLGLVENGGKTSEDQLNSGEQPLPAEERPTGAQPASQDEQRDGTSMDISSSSSSHSINTSIGLDDSRVAKLLSYFPSVSPDDVFCIFCASNQHIYGACPATKCRFCQNQEHPSYACPSRYRCSKCKQLGHAKDQCREKLVLAIEETECGICQRTGHTEASCDELWRSYDPGNPVKKVRLLPVFCYLCGHEGHYGTECGLQQSVAALSRRETWSKQNSAVYQDPSSAQLAIDFMVPPSAFVTGRGADERPHFGGRSIVPQTHVFFEADEDDDNDGFLHAPVQPKPKPGRIRFSGTSGGTRDMRVPTMPPLPPGPPPPLPPQPQGTRRRANGPPARRGRDKKRGKGVQR